MKCLFVLATMLVTTAGLAGTYEVPMRGEVAGMNFLNSDASITTDPDGVTRLRYDLAPELSGENGVLLNMTLQGSPSGIMRFTQPSPAAEASCIRGAGRVRCLTIYEPSIVRFADAEAYLTAHYPEGAFRTLRLAVAWTIAHEAIGILSFDEPAP